ncbi:hypothetical protein DL96DRAFT_1609767 [Flagelloscypha sp. PMI_526]|nr:hypothetical protein DL96DRAFT_1609767 [Flagelloscypha sp. PMI_526]
MSDNGFHSFLTLPKELQGSIWHLALSAMTKKEQLSFILVSKDTQTWVEDIVYRHLYLDAPANLEEILSFAQHHPNCFASKSDSLWFKAPTEPPHMPDLAVALLPFFSGLTRAAVHVPEREEDVLSLLLNIPSLRELGLELHYNDLAPSFLNRLASRPACRTVTHIIAIYKDHKGPPGWLLDLFPCITHLVVNCIGMPKEKWLKTWSSPPTLKVLALVPRWFWKPKDNPLVLDKALAKTPVVIEIPKEWDEQKCWDNTGMIWSAVEDVLRRETVLEDGGPYAIEMKDWYKEVDTKVIGPITEASDIPIPIE